MNVRPASFRDLGRIEQLYRSAAARDERNGAMPAVAGEEPPFPQTTLVRLWHAVSKTLTALVPTADPATAIMVAEDPDQHIVGFVQAQSVPMQPKAWHIVNLCVEPTGQGHFAGAPLVTNLCRQGMEHGVTRFFVRLPVDHPMLGLFLEQGFTQYATEQILFRDDGASAPRVVPSEAPGGLRAARREDVGGIHLLYLRTTPSQIANLEGPSLKAWQASFHQGAMARLGRDDMRHLVAERSGSVVAWVGVRTPSPARPTLLAVMCEGQDAELRDRVVDASLALLPPGPVSCVLRHYDSELIRALQQRDFEVWGAQLLLVRDLAIRVRVPERVERAKKGRLAPASLARSTATPGGSTPPVIRGA